MRTESSRTVRRFIGVATTAVAACGPAEEEPRGYTVSDSAGVRIVSSAEPAWQPGEGWTVADEPRLHIGVVDGAEEYRFTAIAGLSQHGGTWRQSDGTVIASDGISRQIRRYAPDGSFLQGWGGRGDGPGEFQQLGVLPYRGDSILAVDATRYSFYDAEGNLGRMLSLPHLREMDLTSERPRPIASTGFMPGLDDGAFLAVRHPTLTIVWNECRPSSRILSRYTAEGEIIDTIGEFPAPDSCYGDRTSGILPLPFPSEFVYTAHGASVYLSGVDGFEVRRISLDDGSQTLIRASHVDLTTTEADREGFAVNTVEVARSNNMDIPTVRRALLDVVYPPTIPAMSQLLVDPEGNLWVRHYKQRWSEGNETWSVFAPEGYLLGTVDTPEDLQVRQIGRDFLFGIWTDEFDVRYVREYELFRN